MGETLTDFDITITVEATCIRRGFRRIPIYHLNSLVKVDAKIVLDSRAIEKAAAAWDRSVIKPVPIKPTLITIYGHEQLHVRNFQRGAELIVKQLSAAEKQYTFSNRLAAEQYAAQLTKDYEKYWFEQFRPTEFGHNNYKEPEKGLPYEPDGGVMPAGEPRGIFQDLFDPFQPTAPDSNSPAQPPIFPPSNIR